LTVSRSAGREANGKLFQSADISCNRLDLRLVEAVSNRAHDCRCVRHFWILAAFFAPIDQLVDDVGIKLTGQTRNLVGACGIGTVASSACRDVLIRQPVLKDFSACRHELPGAPPSGGGLSALKFAARAATIDWLSECATLNMTLFVRRCSMKACS
jgi:hypothetical protein